MRFRFGDVLGLYRRIGSLHKINCIDNTLISLFYTFISSIFYTFISFLLFTSLPKINQLIML